MHLTGNLNLFCAFIRVLYLNYCTVRNVGFGADCSMENKPLASCLAMMKAMLFCAQANIVSDETTVSVLDSYQPRF